MRVLAQKTDDTTHLKAHFERIGGFRRPVAAFAPRGRATRAFRALWQELSQRLYRTKERKKAGR